MDNLVKDGKMTAFCYEPTFNYEQTLSSFTVAPRSKFLHKNIMAAQLVTKYTALYETQNCITVAPLWSQMHPVHIFTS
jgi:hypothetical protein